MIHSMTGFAADQVILSRKGKQSIVSAQLKSLNSRFFELTCKMPPAFQYLETIFLKNIKEQLLRGHVYLHIYISNPHIFIENIEPLASNLDSYINSLHKIKAQYGITEEIKLDHIIKLPHIFNTEEIVADKQIEFEILQLINNLITKVHVARQQEGIDIARDIGERIELIYTLTSTIGEAANKYIQKTKDKLIAHAERSSIMDNTNTNANMNQSLYALLDKLDIHEELFRLNSHIEHIKKQLAIDKIEKGKVLDFIVQEMMREINTIASKCPDSSISIHTINVKVEIEKIREQIQNIV